MKDIAIYGFGGFGREIACLLNAINKINPTWNLVGFFDDGVEKGTFNHYGQVLGGLDALNNWKEELCIVLAIASSVVLEKISNKVTNPLISFPNIIAPNVLFFDDSSISLGQGNIITFGGRISCGVSLGDFNVLNGNISLGHDVQIASYNVMQPETRISGCTKIGNKNFFGVRSLVLQGLKIGDNTRIGAASLIMRNTKDGKLYFGNPAKLIKEI